MMSGTGAGRASPRSIAYDAAGEVIEDHPLSQCDTPVECEVR